MKEMTPRQRYVAAANHQAVDRLPLDMTFSIGAYNSLARYLGDLPILTECGTNCNVYPDVAFYEKMGIDVTAVDALSLAEQAGSAKASNVVLMGVVSKKMDFDESVWQEALNQCVPAKFIEMNRTAFALGRNI